jgi:DNA-binding transcriptional ArsR family regulator
VVDEAKVFEVLASRVRREIVWMVWDQERSAGEITKSFDLSAPTISEHLSILLDAGVVVLRKERNFRFYRADQGVVQTLHRLLPTDSGKWTPADDIPETAEATARVVPLVLSFVDVDIPVAEAFQAFVDAEKYSQWLGVPVTIEDGRFSTTMEWGSELRGRYNIVVPNELIALHWDIEDENVPLPGQAQIGYMRFFPRDPGCRVEVHQIVENQKQADFMSIAWSLALGRFKQSVAHDNSNGGQPRAPRPKIKEVFS